MDQPLTVKDDAVEEVNGGGGEAEVDPFLVQFQPSDLRTASELLTTWLPFLSRDLCTDCSLALSNRIRSLSPPEAKSDGGEDAKSDAHEPSTSRGSAQAQPKMSWADIAAEEDELGALEDEEEEIEADREVRVASVSAVSKKPKLSREQREKIRFMNVKRKKDFISLERVKGKFVNVLEGLELHKGIFSAAEQKRIVDYVYQLQEMGRRGELRERTFTAPQKWMKGKGRVTIQFGCCYNYATDNNGNPPGILHSETVDPIPSLFKVIIRRLIGWHVLPPSCVPDSCIVNIYSEGDCIPPHIDNHDFLRPFCTVSFLSECDIVFGTNLKIVGPGEFDGPIAIPLPVGSVLVLNGNSADVAKHCVPSVPTKRISITFRRMDEKKRPVSFVPEPDLQGIQPLSYGPNNTKDKHSPMSENRTRKQVEGGKEPDRGFHSEPRYSNRGRRGYAYGPRIKVYTDS